MYCKFVSRVSTNGLSSDWSLSSVSKYFSTPEILSCHHQLDLKYDYVIE